MCRISVLHCYSLTHIFFFFLLSKLLAADPSHRITAREALASPWMRKRDNVLLKNSLLYTSTRLKTFNARMKLKSAMIAVSAVTSAQLSVKRSLKSVTAGDLEDVVEESGEEKKRREPSFMSLPMVKDGASEETGGNTSGETKER